MRFTYRKQQFSQTSPPWCSFFSKNSTNDRFSKYKRVVQLFFRWVSGGLSLPGRPAHTLTYPWPAKIPCQWRSPKDIINPKIIIFWKNSFWIWILKPFFISFFQNQHSACGGRQRRPTVAAAAVLLQRGRKSSTDSAAIMMPTGLALFRVSELRALGSRTGQFKIFEK